MAFCYFLALVDEHIIELRWKIQAQNPLDKVQHLINRLHIKWTRNFTKYLMS